MVGGGEYIFAGVGWWWVVVDLFWLVLGGGIVFSLIHIIISKLRFLSAVNMLVERKMR